MEQSHRDDKGVEEKEVRNYRVKERKTPDGRIQLTGSEDAEQEKVVCWAKLMSNAYPDLELLYHVPNGGSRNKAEVSKLKRMGVRAGVPDLVLPVPRAGYAGLYIELKVGENRPSNNQKDWLDDPGLSGVGLLWWERGDPCTGTVCKSAKDYFGDEGRKRRWKFVEEFWNGSGNPGEKR